MTPGTLITPKGSSTNFMAIDPFRFFNRQMRLLEDPFTAFRPFLPSEEALPFTSWSPPCDIYETEKELVLKMELPEMKKEDVHVTVENNVFNSPRRA